MAFLESIGRSGALQEQLANVGSTAITIRDRAIQERNQAILGQQVQQELAIGQERLNQLRYQNQKEADLRRPMRVEDLKRTMGLTGPEMEQEFDSYLKSNPQYITNIGGQNFASMYAGKMFMQQITENEQLHEHYAQKGIVDLGNAIRSLEQLRANPKIKPQDAQALDAQIKATKDRQAGLVKSFNEYRLLGEKPVSLARGATLVQPGTGNIIAQGEPEQKFENEFDRTIFSQTHHGPPYSPEEVKQAQSALDALDVKRKTEQAVETKKAMDIAAKERMIPLVENAVSSKGYMPNMIGIMGSDRGAFAEALSEKYPNVSFPKLEANARFQGDQVLNRTIVWGRAALPRLESLREGIKTLKPGQFPDANALKNWIAYHLGDDDVAGMMAGTNSVLFEALRSVGGSGTFSDFRLNLEKSNMDISMNRAQFNKAVDNLEAAIKSLQSARQILPYDDIRIDSSKSLTAKPLRGKAQATTIELGGNTLDEETATSILQEAGGDKEKARKIARQRGYKF